LRIVEEMIIMMKGLNRFFAKKEKWKGIRSRDVEIMR
jgi:hypothetical protein